MFPELIEHIVAGYPVIAQSIYLDCHNAVASAVHRSICAQYGFPRSLQWWQHQLQPFLDNDEYKLLYDFNIFTYKRITARRSDMVCTNKRKSCGTFIDVTCVMDIGMCLINTEKRLKNT